MVNFEAILLTKTQILASEIWSRFTPQKETEARNFYKVEKECLYLDHCAIVHITVLEEEKNKSENTMETYCAGN